jgi:hypothetical protein
MKHAPTPIHGPLHDLSGGLSVRRLLPALSARHVGPLVFFDHIGPADFAPGHGMDVRPHPHIGLATVTWLFEGAIRHRDSLGSCTDIRPGEVNWMTAGGGIVHSERTPPDERRDGHRLHGIQIWVALPQADAESAPAFYHHAATELPRVRRPGAELVLIVGTAYGQRSPVPTYAPMFIAEVRLAAGAELELPPEHAEHGVYVVEGDIEWDGLRVPASTMAVQTAIASAPAAPLRAHRDSLLMLFGGAPLDGERHLWWNFVASTRERIDQAKADWVDGRFGTVPGDDQEFIPLPTR